MVKIRTDIQQVSPRLLRDPGVTVAEPGTGFAEGLARLADFAGSKAKEMRRERQDLANASYDTYATTEFQQQMRMAVNEESQKGGVGYADRISQRAQQIIGGIIGREQYDGEQPTQTFLTQTDQRLQKFASKFIVQGITYEHDYNVQQGLQRIGDARQTAEVLVLGDPDSFEATLEEQVESLSNYEFLGPEAVREETQAFGVELADASIRGQLEKAPGSLLEDLEGGRYDKYLTVERKSQFINAAQAKQKSANLKAMRKFQSYQADHFASIAETGKGIEGFSEEADLAYANNPEALATFRRRENLQRTVFTTRKILETQSPEAAQDYLDAQTNPPGSIGFAERQKILDALGTAVTAEAVDDLKALQKDEIARIYELGVSGPDADRIAELEERFLSPDQLDDQKREREKAYEFNRKYNQLLVSDPVEAARLVEETIPGVNAEHFAERVEQSNAVRKAAREIMDRRNADPSAYVMAVDADLEERVIQTRQELALAPVEDIAGRQAAAKAYQRTVRERLTAQEDLGILKPRVLSKSEARQIAFTYNEQPDAQGKSDYIGQLQNQYGPYFNKAVQELGTALPKEAAMAATMTHLGQEPARVRLLAASEVGIDSMRKTITTGVAKDIDNELRDQLAEFNATVATQQFGEEIISKYMGAAQLLAYSYKIRGLDEGEAASAAAEDLVNGYYEFDGRTRIPTKYDGDLISHNLSQMTGNLGEIFDIMAPPSLLDPEADIETEYLETLEETGYWVTNGDDTGVYLRDQKGRNVIQKDGSPVFKRFDEIQEIDPNWWYSLTDFGEGEVDRSQHMRGLTFRRQYLQEHGELPPPGLVLQKQLGTVPTVGRIGGTVGGRRQREREEEQ